MALKVNGSAFYFGDAVEAPVASLLNFYNWLSNTDSTAQWPYVYNQGDVEIRRNLYCSVDGTYCYGIILSARNAEFQHFVRREGNRVIVQEQSTSGNPPVEMNFFAIRIDSNKGIYSHYKGSYPFSIFLNDLWKSYRFFVEMKKTTATTGQSSDGVERINATYSLRYKASHSPLYTPGTFSTLVERLTTISEVRMTSYAVEEHEDRAVSDQIRSVHKEYRFTEDRLNVTGFVRTWLDSFRPKSPVLNFGGDFCQSFFRSKLEI